jgi:ATP-dependent DNA helicase RecQ
VQTVKGDLTDATAAAQEFLSCVKMTGQSFGPGHIITVLCGSRAEKVLARRHDRLSVFGTGKEHSAEQWRTLAQQFIRLGLCEQDFEFGGLRLAPKGWDVLLGKQKVLVPPERASLPAKGVAASERHTRSAIILSLGVCLRTRPTICSEL